MLALLLLPSLLGCKETVSDLLKSSRPQLDELREKIHRGASALPPSPATEILVGPLDPSPELSAVPPFANGYVLPVDASTLDLGVHSHLRKWLKLADPANSALPELAEPPDDDQRVELRTVLGTKYVVFYRTSELTELPAPQLSSVTIEAFLCDVAHGMAIKRAIRTHAYARLGDHGYFVREAHDVLLGTLKGRAGIYMTLESASSHTDVRPIREEAPPPPEPATTPPAVTEKKEERVEPWPSNPKAPPAMIDMHENTRGTLVRELQHAEKLLAEHQDPSNVCRGVMVLDEIHPELGQHAQVRRICVEEATAFWSEGLAAKIKSAKKAGRAVADDCQKARGFLHYVLAGERRDAIATQLEHACPKAK
jgi:hypothetical protein